MNIDARKKYSKIRKRLWKAKKHAKRNKTGAKERVFFWERELSAHILKYGGSS